MLKKIKRSLRQLLNNEVDRDIWVKHQLARLPADQKILDAGCGSQRYREFCSHLEYFGQDFGKCREDEMDSFAGYKEAYRYGELDYVGNIWEINEKDEFFDAILCTEVLEHIPYPHETLREFSRLLKSGGKLIMTVPSNCLRHMDPYFFSSGYSNRFLEYFLNQYNFESEIEVVGDYYKWMMVELSRTMRTQGIFSWLILAPAFLYFYIRQRSPSEQSRNSLCFGYHVVATKKG